MAIAGVQNLSVFESSFLRESQSSASRQRTDEGRASTQASSLLQMWRGLEDEHVVSHAQERFTERLQQQGSDAFNADLLSPNLSESQGSEQRGGSEATSECENESETWSQGQTDSRNDHEDRNSSMWEQSHDFGEVERERVRQIFREWKNSGVRERTSGAPHKDSSSRAQWLGENERERVRIVREWIQMTSQHRGGGSSEEQADEICAQIERVRDGLVVNCSEGQTDHIRRDIRRLCGRQALLDMLVKTERERQRELQVLLEHRAVSNFAYRNRIQSLLRGRFLRNERLIADERQTSVAASELGFLRQRHTVSGLREGFLSRLDNFGHGQGSSNHSDTSSNNVINGYGNEETQADSSQEVLGGVLEQSVHNVEDSVIHGLLDHTEDLESNTVDAINCQESVTEGEEWQEQVSENEERDRQQTATVEFDERRGEDRSRSWQDSTANGWFQETPEHEGGEQVYLQEDHGVFHEQSEPANQESDVHGLSDHSNYLEGNNIDDINGQESSSIVEDWQEQVMANEEREQQRFSRVESNNLRDTTGEDMERNWQESTINGWLQETSGNEGGEPGHLQENLAEWHDDGSQEALENWLEGPSSREGVHVDSVDAFFLPDDDNVYTRELRELLSRRRVSNLLHSGFRESLDQLIQSYVERQNRDPIEWEMHRVLPSPASAEQDQEQQSEDQNDDQSDSVERPPPILPSPPVFPSRPLWDQELHNANWRQDNMHQRLGIEWELINDLRVDMARLQQRLNNMQRMLEACMDMQLELQRSVRQEVSAALNRSDGLPELCEDGLPEDGSKWDHVRKGICCICCDNNIDSLLYRCGHMCTCSKCANELVRVRGKCPMCWAPVVEVIRAYSIQ